MEHEITISVKGKKRYHVWASNKGAAILQAMDLWRDWTRRRFTPDLRTDVFDGAVIRDTEIVHHPEQTRPTGEQFWTITFHIEFERKA